MVKRTTVRGIRALAAIFPAARAGLAAGSILAAGAAAQSQPVDVEVTVHQDRPVRSSNPPSTAISPSTWDAESTTACGLASRHARGDVLRPRIDTGHFAAGSQTAAPTLIASVVHDPASGAAAVFALNRSTDQAMELRAELRGLGERRLTEALALHHTDLKAVNDSASPERIAPAAHDNVTVRGEQLTARLEPLSWNVFATEHA